MISNRGHGHYIDADPSDALIKGKSSLLKIGHFNDPSFKNLPDPGRPGQLGQLPGLWRCWYLALRNKGRGLTAMNRSFRCLLHLNFLDILVVILEFNLKRRQAIKVLTPGVHSLFKRISRKHLPTSCNMLSTPYTTWTIDCTTSNVFGLYTIPFLCFVVLCVISFHHWYNWCITTSST